MVMEVVDGFNRDDEARPITPDELEASFRKFGRMAPTDEYRFNNPREGRVEVLRLEELIAGTQTKLNQYQYLLIKARNELDYVSRNRINSQESSGMSTSPSPDRDA